MEVYYKLRRKVNNSQFTEEDINHLTDTVLKRRQNVYPQDNKWSFFSSVRHMIDIYFTNGLTNSFRFKVYKNLPHSKDEEPRKKKRCSVKSLIRRFIGKRRTPDFKRNY